MTNFLPLEGRLVPRSRLSSLNTIDTVKLGSSGGPLGMYELPRANLAQPELWVSGNTNQFLVSSNGSISMASFVSTFGIGIAGLASQTHYQYAWAFSDLLNDNMGLAVGTTSANTIMALYRDAVTGKPLFSFLTSAPQTFSVGVFDHYVLAWNIQGTGLQATTRIQWCVRGEPSNWTGEGSGFEDLLDAKGMGTAVREMGDGRLLLFTDVETWYAVRASYPAQFQFYPLDTSVGCPFPKTIQECDLGTLFLGSDFALRLLPRGGGASRVLIPSLSPTLRRQIGIEISGIATYTWAVFDPRTRLYYLFMAPTATNTNYRPIVVNIDTGEWGFILYKNFSETPMTGIAMRVSSHPFSGSEGVFWGISTGTICSATSTGPEFGSAITATWRSAPIAADLPGNYKQLLNVNVDYLATSRATLTLKITADGNTSQTTGQAVSLAPAPIGARARADVYTGGIAPVIELTSTSTGYELHRLDVTMNLGGRGA